MEQPKRDPVLRDPRRRTVHRLLGRVGPGLQELHRDGCRIVDGEFPLESAVNALGNCAREIESAVRGLFVDLLLEPHDETACPDTCARCKTKIRHQSQTQRTQIEQILAALKITDPDVLRVWLGLTDLAAITHRRGLEKARPLAQAHRDTWRRLEDLLAILLPHLEERFVALLPTYRALAELPAPTKADRTRFRRLPNTLRLRREFLDNATAAWFPLLDADHFFDQPEDAFTYDADTDARAPQHWPAIDFLVRMSALPEQRERFVAIVERMAIPHEWALHDLVKATGALPAPLAARVATAVRRWVDAAPYLFLAGGAIAELSVALAARGDAPAAMELLGSLLALGPEPAPPTARTPEEAAMHKPEPVTKLRDYEYELAVERGLIACATYDPGAVFGLSVTLLAQALVYSERAGRASEYNDSSTWWRQSLVDDRGRYGHEYANLLANATLASTRLILTTEPGRIGEIVVALERERWVLCRRIALQLLAEYPDAALVRERLLDATLIEAAGTWPEFRRLLERGFAALTDDDRRVYVGRVEAFPGDEGHPAGSPYQREWILRRLRPIGEHLDADVRARYPELTGTRVEGTSDEADIEVRTGWVGDTPQVSTEQLVAMPNEAIFAHLRTWVPAARFDGPNVEGQGQALRAAVMAEPARFSAVAMSFVSLDYTYLRALFEGVEQALQSNGAAEVRWAPLLELATWVTTQQAVAVRPSFSQDPDWTWTHRAIADLLHVGLGEIPSAVPAEAADQVWMLIAWLAERGANAHPPRASDTADEAADEQDALSAALNSARGETLQAAIAFVVWRWRQRGSTGPAISSEPRAAALLTAHLDHTRDASLAARGVFGSRLPQLIALDAEWVRAQLPHFFPVTSPLTRSLTWQAYVLWNQPFTSVLTLLREEYRAAIDRLRPSTHARLDVGEKLAEHLISFYLTESIDINSDDGLLRAFYEHAPASTRGQATAFAGHVLRDQANAARITSAHCERLQRLWTWRRQVMADRPHTERRAELEQFGWWFASSACDQAWLLRELIETLQLTGSIENDSLVMEKLVALAPSEPHAVLQAVELMIEAPKERWLVQVWIDQIVAIIGATVNTTADERARRLGARLIADNYDNGLVDLLRPREPEGSAAATP